ncbi:MAG TPA: hypothetical protein DCZ92_11030 [Elusimicrobia bacterium]|nr:MAG: hypothetical protein A2016_00655 [Elusimicrobia bacterium GWF2_62_30]HBA61327.1 hypothetical protein [Elusimicrobiota bacterium]
MSVSSHLTPDPERRLRLIHGNIYDSLKWTDRKLAAVALLAMLEMSAIGLAVPGGTLARLALLALCLAALVSAVAGSPFIETLKPVPLLDQRGDKPRPGDTLVSEYDVARYSQAELTALLDRYLGGGVTGTPYYEDIVGQIVIGARVATRKRRLFAAACTLAILAQLCLAIRLAAGLTLP